MAYTFDPTAFLTRVGRRLVDEFDDASQASHPGLIGSARENPARQQLERFLPGIAAIGSGIVIDISKNSSLQQDIVVYDRGSCPVFMINDTPEATFYPVEGVIACGEIKSYLDKEKLEDSFRKAASVKRLNRQAVPTPLLPGSDSNTVDYRFFGLTADFSGTETDQFDQKNNPQDQIFTFVLAGDSLSSKTIFDHALHLYRTTPIDECPNMIAILDKGIICGVSSATCRMETSAQTSDTLVMFNDGVDGFSILVDGIVHHCRHGRTVSASHFRQYLHPSSTTRSSIHEEKLNP